MMFKSGAGVEVIENKHYMASRVYLPWEFVVSVVLRNFVPHTNYYEEVYSIFL